MKDLFGAIEDMLANIDNWNKTGEVAGPEESHILYDNLKTAYWKYKDMTLDPEHIQEWIDEQYSEQNGYLMKIDSDERGAYFIGYLEALDDIECFFRGIKRRMLVEVGE